MRWMSFLQGSCTASAQTILLNVSTNQEVHVLRERVKTFTGNLLACTTVNNRGKGDARFDRPRGGMKG